MAELKAKFLRSAPTEQHVRLDEVLEEEKSRVRSGRAAHILRMCHRLVVSLAHAWLKRAKGNKTHCRKSARDF